MLLPLLSVTTTSFFDANLFLFSTVASEIFSLKFLRLEM